MAGQPPVPLLPWQWRFPPGPPSLPWRVCSSLVLQATYLLSKLFWEFGCRVRVHGQEHLQGLLRARAHGVGVVSVCNHPSCLDDPLLWGLMPWSALLRPGAFRWSLAADNICYTRPLHAAFFTFGRTIPVRRGSGVYQRGVDFAIEQLDRGEWVHVFPEAGVNQTDVPRRFKWGVGRLVASARITPLVYPMWMEGMQAILPNGTYIPRLGGKVDVMIGEPLSFAEVVREHASNQATEEAVRKAVTDAIQERMYQLRDLTRRMHSERP